MSPVKTIRGGAIRLFKPKQVLGVAEGIETAIACYELAQSRGHELPMWALFSANNMEVWEPPANVTQVVICADHDANLCGHKAAYTLAHRMLVKGYDVEVRIPPEPGQDWLDVLVQRTRRAAA